MRIPISTKIVEQSSEEGTVCIREVRLFGWLVKREEMYSDCEERQRPVGFNVFPDQREYIEDD